MNTFSNVHCRSLLHIEDDALWGHTIRQFVQSWQEYRYLGVATTAAAGLALCHEKHPDVAIVDRQLPDADGFDLALSLANLPRPPRILVLTSRADEVTLFRAGQACVAGMLWKTGPVRELLRTALAEVIAGRRFFPPDVREAMRMVRSNPVAFFKILSGRELSLLPLLCEDGADDRVAAETGLSPATVRSHRQHIMAKLDLHRSADLIRWAAEKGFVDFLHPRRTCV